MQNKDSNVQFSPVVVSTDGMHLDETVHQDDESQVIPLEQNEDLSEGKHMHPVQQRPTIKTVGLSFPQPIPISPVTSGSTTTDSSSSSSSSVSGASYFASCPSSTATSVEDCSPQSEMCVNPDYMRLVLTLTVLYMRSPTCSLPSQPRSESSTPSDVPTELTPSPSPVNSPNAVPSSKTQTPPTFSPPLLTSTFRPKEFLRRVETEVDDRYRKSRSGRNEKSDSDLESEGEWEFVPARVPDGISLRNFGIQVVSSCPRHSCSQKRNV